MRVNVAIPEAQVTKPVLDAALESVTRLNEQLIKGGHPTFEQALPSGIRWKPEPPGAEHFDHAGIVARRGWGDCDDLAPWHAASLRITGQDPGAQAVVTRSGPNRWHAVVQRSDGSIDDPSKAAGMGQPQGVSGAWLPLMNPTAPNSVSGVFIARPSLALRPAQQGFQARVDLPWHWKRQLQDEPSPTDYAMTSLHTAPIAPQALVGALDGAILLGECAGFAHPEHLTRLRCLADACEGMPYPELVSVYGYQHADAAAQVVGSFFGDVFRAVSAPVKAAAQFVQRPSLSNLSRIVTDPLKQVSNVVRPLTNVVAPFAPALNFIPGVGPIASSALNVLQHGLPTNFGDIAKMGLNFVPGAAALKTVLPMATNIFEHGIPTDFSSLMRTAAPAIPGPWGAAAQFATGNPAAAAQQAWPSIFR